MEIELMPITVESDSGAVKVLWEWSVTTKNGRSLAGLESGFNTARFYIMVACFRFLFTNLKE